MKRPKSHKAGDIAENTVAGAFLRDGWVVNSCASDYGYDFLIQRLEGSEGKPLFAFLQVKGTAQHLVIEADGTFSFVFEVDHLVYWDKTPIPVYVCIVEIESSTVYVFNAGEAVVALQRRLGDDWSNARTRSVTVEAASALDMRRASEVLEEVDDYWKQTRKNWSVAEAAARMGRSLYTNWLGGCMMLEGAVTFQTNLNEVMGSEQAGRELLTNAGLRPVRMP